MAVNGISEKFSSPRRSRSTSNKATGLDSEVFDIDLNRIANSPIPPKEAGSRPAKPHYKPKHRQNPRGGFGGLPATFHSRGKANR